ncbi:MULTISPECIES: carboxylate--amine ligase [Halostella]|uniref:carboxylate--amine ligase n=1 Tax=Halostella TaxID=1843185 RepID=UPI001964FC00|nr:MULTISPECIES: carboxylate--amine ligase [Halostella]
MVNERKEGVGEDGAAVLVGGGPGRDYPCVRSLKERGITTIFACTDAKSPVCASRYCDETQLIPSPREDLHAFKDALLEIAARREVKTIVPTREDCVHVLSKYLDAFEGRVSLVVPPFQTLRTANDRLRLAEAAEEAGVPVPETRLLTEVDDWSRRSIIKSRYNLLTEENAEGVPRGQVETVKAVTHLDPGERPDVEGICEEMRHVPIVQEFVPTDDEFVFAALYDRGEPLATFQHRQVRGDSYVGGGGVYRKSVFDRDLQTTAERLLDHLDWHGLACIEYMRDANTGEFVLTEINPRTWQSLSAAVHAGADFPLYYWLAAAGRAAAIDPAYELDAGTHSLYGELQHFLSLFGDGSPHVERPPVAATGLAILSSLYEDPYFDYTRLDDPGPFFSGASLVARNLLQESD